MEQTRNCGNNGFDMYNIGDRCEYVQYAIEIERTLHNMQKELNTCIFNRSFNIFTRPDCRSDFPWGSCHFPFQKQIHQKPRYLRRFQFLLRQDTFFSCNFEFPK